MGTVEEGVVEKGNAVDVDIAIVTGEGEPGVFNCREVVGALSLGGGTTTATVYSNSSSKKPRIKSVAQLQWRIVRVSQPETSQPVVAGLICSVVCSTVKKPPYEYSTKYMPGAGVVSISCRPAVGRALSQGAPSVGPEIVPPKQSTAP